MKKFYLSFIGSLAYSVLLVSNSIAAPAPLPQPASPPVPVASSPLYYGCNNPPTNTKNDCITEATTDYSACGCGTLSGSCDLQTGTTPNYWSCWLTSSTCVHTQKTGPICPTGYTSQTCGGNQACLKNMP